MWQLIEDLISLFKTPTSSEGDIVPTKGSTRPDRWNELKSYVDKGYFIHLSDYNKFGIYPGSEYNTPLGIYTYPLNSRIFRQIENSTLPFALEREYIHICKPKESAKILNLESMTHGQFRMYGEALTKLYPETETFYNIKTGQNNLLTSIQGKYGKMFWRLTYHLARYSSFVWNKIFRQLGIDGVYDSEGDGIIHENEPEQAVFFHKLAVDHITVIINPSDKNAKYIEKHPQNSERKQAFIKKQKQDKFKKIQQKSQYQSPQLKLFDF